MFLRRLFNFSFYKKTPGGPAAPVQARRLPDTMPADFKLELTSSGTFVRKSETILVQENNFSIKSQYGKEERSFQINDFPKQNMIRLYEVLKKNNFDKIKIKKALRLDYPRYFIEATWGNYFLYKGESQTEEMSYEMDVLFRTNEFGLYDIFREVLKPHGKSINVRLDYFLLNNEWQFSLSSTDPIFRYYYYFPYEKSSVIPDVMHQDSILEDGSPREIYFLPGYTMLTATWGRKGQYPHTEYIVPLPGKDFTSGTLFFYVENKKLQWSVEI